MSLNVSQKDIPVDDVFGVQVEQSVCHLLDVLGSLFFCKPARFPQVSVQLALGRILQDQIDPPVVVKVSIQPEYVGMPQVGLDFHLPPQLLLHLALLQLLLVEHLEGDDEAGPFFSGQIDMSKLALPQRLAQLKV